MPVHHHVEAVLGYVGPLPPFAPYPPLAVQEQLGASQWDEYLAAYTTLADRYLKAIPETFSEASPNLRGFLQTYYEGVFNVPKQSTTQHSHNAIRLRQQAFALTHRALLETRDSASRLLNWGFLGCFCHAYLKVKSLGVLLQTLWHDHEPELRKTLGDVRSKVISVLESKELDVAGNDLKRLAPLLHSLPQAASYMTEGSEFIDGLSIAYIKGAKAVTESIVPVAYLSLVSLTRPETLNRSALIDHLYSLKSQAESVKSQPTLLAELVTNTPLLTKLAGQAGEKGAERARTLAASLQAFKMPSIARTRPSRPLRAVKGKASASTNTASEHHVHLLSKISQIQDLFPDLGSGFVAKLLDHYVEDVELITSHLLEDSLPPSLANLDRSLPLTTTHSTSPSDRSAIDSLIPTSTPHPNPSYIPKRHNIHDNDAFDLLTISPSQLHTGHRDTTPAAPTAETKASILAALAAFDSDDDERDDTYDAADVGGTIDRAAPDGDPEAAADYEEHLFRAYRADPAAFGRSADTRRGAARAALRAATGLTDEAIEGWGVMLGRDPGRLRRLEERYAAFDGAQAEVVQRTRWQDGGEESNSGGERGGGQGRGRGGRGRGGRGGGASVRGDVAGQTGERTTQVARQRKEAGKSRGANHGRREGRARKMARAGFPG